MSSFAKIISVLTATQDIYMFMVIGSKRPEIEICQNFDLYSEKHLKQSSDHLIAEN